MEMTYTGGRRRAACIWNAQPHLDEHPCSRCAPLRDPSIAHLNLGVPLCVVVMFGELRYIHVWHFKGLSSLVKVYCVEKVNVSARGRAKFLSIRGGLPGLSFNAHIQI